jgi:hypothetical protein
MLLMVTQPAASQTTDLRSRPNLGVRSRGAGQSRSMTELGAKLPSSLVPQCPL